MKIMANPYLFEKHSVNGINHGTSINRNQVIFKVVSE